MLTNNVSDNALIDEIIEHRISAPILVRTLGNFQVTVENQIKSSKEWGRDKTIQLFQFLVTSKFKSGIHKEQIINRLWEDLTEEEGDRDFKVAMHGVNKLLEPNRPSRTDPTHIVRQGLTYAINRPNFWIDTYELEKLIKIGNANININKELAIKALSLAVDIYQGPYLPNRTYEDWSIQERERIQVLVLGAYISLAGLLVELNSTECIRLTQEALLIDNTWEDAYRIQMQAYFNQGNRPLALKAYKRCVELLDEEYGIEPLPITKQLWHRIMAV